MGMIRMEKGNPDDAELAAVTVVLLAALAASTERATGNAEFADWDHPEWTLVADQPWPRSGFVVSSWRRRPEGAGR